ncbi:MAG: helix-turn-helix domain-containing protein [Actinomycetota bacterium]
MAERVFHCPVEVAMDVIGRRWTAVILAHLKARPRRYSELHRLIPDITEKMLTQRLAELVDDGVVARTERPTAGRHVEYGLTELGRSLEPALQALYDWGEFWADERALAIDEPFVD